MEKKKTTSDGVNAGVKKLAIAASSCSGTATWGNATFKALRDMPKCSKWCDFELSKSIHRKRKVEHQQYGYSYIQ